MRNCQLGIDIGIVIGIDIGIDISIDVTVLTYLLLRRKRELCKRFTEKERACGRGGHYEKSFPVIQGGSNMTGTVYTCKQV